MSSGKYEVLLIRLNGKNYSAWAFQFEIFVKGKNLWGHVDGSKSAPNKDTQKDGHAKWEVQEAQVMAWNIGSVDLNIVLNLRPFKTAASIWAYLKKTSIRTTLPEYSNSSMTLQLQDSLSISEFYSRFMNLWSEYIDIVYENRSSKGLCSVQLVHETTKRDQFLMKLRSDFEVLGPIS
ncbi:hypothetical protein LR48_Vigan02g216900 [Vigna angularis]|uniref:Retrotransposon Copia-like N-terminal domain-containing protein n=1 Tax=Phaseolus angularis TaxID=3914 RepID=A0A0L9U0U2_PHAAN|nr:hypothetical protein LR48_Vigan02g216900 [Vigna angularis]